MEHSDTASMWDDRFGSIDKPYHEQTERLLEIEFAPLDRLHHFPLFAGHVNLARYLSLYEAFKMVAGRAGHYADVGAWFGSSFLFVAKLIRVFEPYSSTRVHAFDWFQGMNSEQTSENANYHGSFEKLRELVQIQGLSDVAAIHKLDLKSELEAFSLLPRYSEIRFKYVFVDCGLKDVLEQVVPFFWRRLLSGGIMVFDHFSTDVPSETSIVLDTLPGNCVFKHFEFSRSPTAYVIK